MPACYRDRGTAAETMLWKGGGTLYGASRQARDVPVNGFRGVRRALYWLLKTARELPIRAILANLNPASRNVQRQENIPFAPSQYPKRALF